MELVITPASVTVPPGGTQQFTARGVAITGDTVAVDVVWSATGGTITSGGFFTASLTGGEILVTAELAPPEIGGEPVIFPRRAVLSRVAARRPG